MSARFYMKSFPCPIAYISNASWHYGLPTNRQQLPQRLANHAPVLYSSPFSLSQALMGQVPFRQVRPGLEQVSPNLYLFHNLQILPMVRGQLWPLKQFDQHLRVRSLRRYIGALGLRNPVLWLYFPPSFQHLLGQLGESLTCYHCTDDHAGRAEVLGFDRQKVEEDEIRLVQAVDVVFVTSRPLYLQKVQYNPNTYLMPNVANIERFTPVAHDQVPVALELRDLPGPVAGFVGAVDGYKVDFALIEQVAQMLSDWTFVFVGPVGSGDGTSRADLPALPNVRYLGYRDYSLLPGYVAGFDVCMIPYHLNPYTAGVFPLKFWEYLASGKPVVTTPLPALSEYYPHVGVGNSPSAFAEALQRAFTRRADMAARQQRLDLAAGQSWEKRAAEMLEVLRRHL